MEDGEKRYTFDEALSSIGVKTFQYTHLAYAALGWVAEAMEMTLLSFVGPAIATEWGISPRQQSLISTVSLLGMLVGYYLWGVVSDSYGRKKGFLGASIIAIMAGLLTAGFAKNYISLLIFRFFSGIGLGCGYVFMIWFMEFVPFLERGTWMAYFPAFWTLGSIMEASLAWWIIPTCGWRLLVGLSTIPYLMTLLFYPLIQESPRYLYAKGRINEALDVLKIGAELNNKEFKGIVTGSAPLYPLQTNEPWKWSMFKLLKPPLTKTTVLLWLLYFTNMFSYYGILLLTSQLSITGQKECHKSTSQAGNILDKKFYINVFITSFADIPGIVLLVFIMDRIFRKKLMSYMAIGGFIALLPVVLQIPIWTTVFLFGARMFISASFNTLCIYAPEVYPTTLRATGVGISMAIARFSAIICPLITTALMGSNCQQTIPPVILFEVTILVQVIGVIFLPFETKGKESQDVIESPVHPPLLQQ